MAEIQDTLNRIKASAEGKDPETQNVVEEWLRARGLDEHELDEVAVEEALAALMTIAGEGEALNNIRCLFCAAFHIGFEVAAHRYAAADPREVS